MSLIITIIILEYAVFGLRLSDQSVALDHVSLTGIGNFLVIIVEDLKKG